jgi:hypothetical protein
MTDTSSRGAVEADLSRATWKKSSYSSANGECVEVAVLDGAVAVRDSKNPDGGALVFRPEEWTSFLHGVVAGEFAAP